MRCSSKDCLNILALSFCQSGGFLETFSFRGRRRKRRRRKWEGEFPNSLKIPQRISVGFLPERRRTLAATVPRQRPSGDSWPLPGNGFEWKRLETRRFIVFDADKWLRWLDTSMSQHACLPFLPSTPPGPPTQIARRFWRSEHEWPIQMWRQENTREGMWTRTRIGFGNRVGTGDCRTPLRSLSFFRKFAGDLTEENLDCWW